MHFIIAAVLFLDLALAIPTTSPFPNGNVKHIPIRRSSATHASGELDEVALLRSIRKVLHRYKPDVALPDLPELFHGPPSKRDSNDVPLTSQNGGGYDSEYFGNCSIGDQTWLLNFDTGSADAFIPGPNCTDDLGCRTGQRYDGKGTDLQNITTLMYGSGYVTGEKYLDTISCGGLAAANASIVVSSSEWGFYSAQAQGLMGLAASWIAQTQAPTFFEMLMDEGKVAARQFGFYLGRLAEGTQADSLLTLGGNDTAKYEGDVTCLDAVGKGYWQVACSGFNVGEDVESVNATAHANIETSGGCVLDTGTTLTVVSTSNAIAIHALIPGSVPLGVDVYSTSLWAIPCNYSGPVNLIMGGRSFSYNQLDFHLGQYNETTSQGALNAVLNTTVSDGMCISSFMAADIADPTPDPAANPASNITRNLTILGDTFLKSWYTIYAYESDNRTQESVCLGKAVGN